MRPLTVNSIRLRPTFILLKLSEESEVRNLSQVDALLNDNITINIVNDRYVARFFFQAEDGIRDRTVTGVQTCALPILERPPAVVVDEDDTAFIMYTSGTTGRPKGALGTHVGIVTSSISFERCMGLGDGERTLVAVPLFHVTGLIGQLLTMAWLGGTTVVMRTFDAAEAIRLLDAERITYMIAAPTVFTMMLQQPGARDAGRSLRRVGYGGAPTPPPGHGPPRH